MEGRDEKYVLNFGRETSWRTWGDNPNMDLKVVKVGGEWNKPRFVSIGRLWY